MRSRSRKMERTYVDRRRLVGAMLDGQPLCQGSLKGICTGYATEVHELLTRARGGSITDPENCVALCHACHAWVTTHPAEAHDLGLMRSQFCGGCLTGAGPHPYRP